MHRRHFLAAAFGTLAAPVPAAERIPIAFLGASHPHAKAKISLMKESPRWSLLGIAEDDPAVRASFEKAGIPVLSRERVLDDPGIAVIAVESSVKDHAADARAALQAGKHVHLEKPPATTMAELRELVTLA